VYPANAIAAVHFTGFLRHVLPIRFIPLLLDMAIQSPASLAWRFAPFIRDSAPLDTVFLALFAALPAASAADDPTSPAVFAAEDPTSPATHDTFFPAVVNPVLPTLYADGERRPRDVLENRPKLFDRDAAEEAEERAAPEAIEDVRRPNRTMVFTCTGIHYLRLESVDR
jgi:hypothetical protein